MAQNYLKIPDFKRVMRGYAPEQVDSFIAAVQERYSAICSENERLKMRISSMIADEKKRGVEEEMRRSELDEAEEEADRVLDEAQKRADNLLYEAAREARRVRENAKNDAEAIIAEAEERRETLIAEADLYSDEAKSEAVTLLEDRDEMLRRAERVVDMLRQTLENEYARMLGVIDGLSKELSSSEEASDKTDRDRMTETDEAPAASADVPAFDDQETDSDNEAFGSEGEEKQEEDAAPRDEGEEEPEEDAAPWDEGGEEPGEDAAPWDEGEEEPEEDAAPWDDVEEEPAEEEGYPSGDEDGQADVGAEDHEGPDDTLSDDFTAAGSDDAGYHDYDLSRILQGLEHMTRDKRETPVGKTSGSAPQSDDDIVSALKEKFGDDGSGASAASAEETDFYEDEEHEDGEEFNPNVLPRYRK